MQRASDNTSSVAAYRRATFPSRGRLEKVRSKAPLRGSISGEQRPAKANRERRNALPVRLYNSVYLW